MKQVRWTGLVGSSAGKDLGLPGQIFSEETNKSGLKIKGKVQENQFALVLM